MAPGQRRGVLLIEPDINPVTRRFSLPNIANYPPLPQARLAGQLEQAESVEIADLRIAGEKERLLERIRRDPPALAGISLAEMAEMPRPETKLVTLGGRAALAGLPFRQEH